MLNVINLKFKRLIVHHISEKLTHQDTASVEYEKELFALEKKVETKIKERLQDALGRDSKSFELEIENTDETSFFSLAKSLSESNKKQFIAASQTMADLLANAQTRNSIPGGKLIIIDCLDASGLGVTIALKAELHEAFQQAKSKLELLDNIFLSPSQKLFKIGIIHQKNQKEKDVNKAYGAILFDDQFRADAHPAEYFYKTFLGFSISKNTKIQSKRFYDKTESFIKENFNEPNKRGDLINALKLEFTQNIEPVVTPTDFANRYFKKDIKDKYVSEVANELPGSFVKDRTLIETTLAKRKIVFPNDVRIFGPEKGFDKNVKLMESQNDLDKLDCSDQSYSILKIVGKPQ